MYLNNSKSQNKNQVKSVKISISLLPETQKRLLNRFIRLCQIFKIVYPNQTTIGQLIGVGRQTTNELIGKLCGLGLLEKTWRGVKKTCTYRIPAFMQEDGFVRKYCGFLPDLVGYLKPLTNQFIVNDPTQALYIHKDKDKREDDIDFELRSFLYWRIECHRKPTWLERYKEWLWKFGEDGG